MPTAEFETELDELIQDVEDNNVSTDTLAKAHRLYSDLLQKGRRYDDDEDEEDAPPHSKTHEGEDVDLQDEDDESLTDMPKMKLKRGRKAREEGKRAQAEDTATTGFGKSAAEDLEAYDLEEGGLEESWSEIPGAPEMFSANPVLVQLLQRDRAITKAMNASNLRQDAIIEEMGQLRQLAEQSLRVNKSLQKSLRSGAYSGGEGVQAEEPPTTARDAALVLLRKAIGDIEARLAAQGQETQNLRQAVSSRPYSPHPVDGGGGNGTQPILKSLAPGSLPESVITRTVKAFHEQKKLTDGQLTQICRGIRMAKSNGTPYEKLIQMHAPGVLPEFLESVQANLSVLEAERQELQL